MTDKEKRYSDIEDNVNNMCNAVAKYIYASFREDEEVYETILLNTACSFIFASITAHENKIEASDVMDAISYVLSTLLDFTDEFNSGIHYDDFTELGGDYNDSSTTN